MSFLASQRKVRGFFAMDKQYPQRLFRQGHEPTTYQINNSCKMQILDHMKETLPIAYDKVMKHEVFGPILELHENNMGFSAKLVHSMLTRQLVTKTQHAMWFTFGKKPLRFSLQEFHAVTGLKCIDDFKANLDDWKDDGGFWSKVLRTRQKVTIFKMKKLYLKEADGWNKRDKKRMVYLAVIAGIIFGYHEGKVIPTEYIKLVMDKDKDQDY